MKDNTLAIVLGAICASSWWAVSRWGFISEFGWLWLIALVSTFFVGIIVVAETLKD